MLPSTDRAGITRRGARSDSPPIYAEIDRDRSTTNQPMDIEIDKDRPLKADTRLLGRVLVDVLRAQAGEDGFARIEAIRRTAILFRRAAGDEAAGARDELAALLNPLPVGDVLHVVRAFSYFSH